MLNARSRGMGGGGAIFAPEISPRGPNIIFVTSDRSGLYRSDNGGDSWVPLDERIVQGSSRFSVAYHPVDDKILAFHPQRGFLEGAHDPDAAWALVASVASLKYPAVGMPDMSACSTTKPGVTKVAPRTDVVVTAAAYCPDDPGAFLVGTERGIARFSGGQWSWVFPGGAGSPATFDDYSVPDPERGTGIANAADVIRFLVLRDPLLPGRWLYFVATACDIITSYDQGRTWLSIAAGLPGRSLGLVRPGRPRDTQAGTDGTYMPSRIRGFAGASGNGYYALFASIATVDDLTLSSGGVWAYDGSSWRRAMGGQINTFNIVNDPSDPKPAIPGTAESYLPRYEHLGVAANDPSTVYVTCQNTARAYPAVYRGAYSRSSNALTWAPAYDGVATHTQPAPQPPGGTLVRNVDPGWVERDFGWAFGGPATGFAVAPTDAKVAVFANRRALHLTKNGGANAGASISAGQAPPKDWASVYTLRSSETPPRWEGTGIDAVSVWNYYAEQDYSFGNNRHRRANSDIGVTQSLNDGGTWRSSRPDCQSENPPASCATAPSWPHIYELAFGSSGGQSAIWAAASDVDGIPSEVSLAAPPDGNGAVLLSLDDGATWSELPKTGLPAGPITSVLRVGSSVYAAVWFSKAASSGGIYRLDDGATSWVQVGGASPGRLPYRLAVDPTNQQKVYCLVQGDGAGTKSGVYSQIGTGGWIAEGPIEGFSPIDLIVHQSASQKTELYVSTFGTAATKGGDVWKLVTGIWQPLAAFAPTADKPVVKAFSLAFVEDMAYTTSLTHGVRCARRADVEAFDGTQAIDWVDYPAAPVERITRIAGTNDRSIGRSRLYLGTVAAGAHEVTRQIYCVLDKSTFSREDFNIRAAGASKYTYNNVGWVVLDGFLPKELGVKTVADLNANKPRLSIADTPGLSIGALGDALVEMVDPQTGALPATVGQRIAFPFSLTIDLTRGDPFPPTPGPGQPPQIDYVYVSAQSPNGAVYATEAQIELGSWPQPFMVDGPVGWASQDLCVFKALPGTKVAFGQDLEDDKPIDFLKKVLDHLNDPANANASAEFDLTRDGGQTTLQLATKENGVNAYNFALARVHYLGSTVAASDVSVFFRLFSAAFTGFDYDRYGAYQLDGSGRVPLLGIKAGADQTGEVVSIPFFGAPRLPAGSDMALQTDPGNFHQAIPAKGSKDSIRYFGAWLDFNQQTPLYPRQPGSGSGPFPTEDMKSIQELIRGRHQCLVAEINLPGDPIENGATPQTSDKLAQRNLSIVDSDNPGSVDTHTVQHSFEISAPKPEADVSLLRRRASWEPEDELVFDWGNVPRDARARLLLPDIEVNDLLALARRRGGPTRFRRLDAHTIACTVGDLSYLPLPQNRIQNLVALLTVELPPTVVYGQEFRAIVRQVEVRPDYRFEVPSLRRRVLGTFELRIPVKKAETLLPEEERQLAVLRYIQRGLDKDDPWQGVIKEYVRQTAARVDGFGGDSAAIPASPNGSPSDQSSCASCLQAAWAQLEEAIRTGDLQLAAGALRAGSRCLGLVK